jgi:hypothetical protein
VNSTCLPEDSLDNDRVSGIIKWRGQRQHSNSYNIEFQFKTYKSIMLPADEVHPYLDGIPATGPPTEGVDDSDRITLMINRIPDSELGLCPDSDDERGIGLDLTEESDCVRIISDADPFDDATWIRRRQGNVAFIDQDTYDDLPMLVDDVCVHEKEYMLDWEEEGELPKPTENMKDTPGCLRKGREKNCRAPVITMMLMLPLLFWKI